MPMSVWIIAVLLFALAWANGANDVSKGIATLVGSSACTGKRAVYWGTLWTIAGGMAAAVWGGAMVETFSKGLLAPGHALNPALLAGIAGGACAWVALATRFGLPVSTTHALLGGLVGATLAATGPQDVLIFAVVSKALLPLLVSPLIAIALCWSVLLVGRYVAARVPGWQPGCCARETWDANPYACADAVLMTRRDQFLRRVWPVLHWLSGGVTCFARALNDVPKIAAFFILVLALSPESFALDSANSAVMATMAVTLAMGAGSLWGGMRVLRMLAHRVTPLDSARGLVANTGTSLLVLLATPFGLPVSTTHVSTGALIGIRLASGTKPDQQDALSLILFGWIITLPVAACFAAFGVWLQQTL